MTKNNFKELSETEMQLAGLEQRRYIRNELKGSDYFFSKTELNVEEQVDELMVEVTKYGFNKVELDKKLNEKNKALELFAIENGLTDEYYNAQFSEEHTKNARAKKGLEESLELLRGIKGNSHDTTIEETPLTEHEEILKKLEDIERQNSSGYEKDRFAMNDLGNQINSFF